MENVDKAAVRIKHWMEHNDHHLADYAAFAKQLEDAGKSDSAKHIKEMAALTRKTSECLRQALLALDKS